MPRKGSRDLQKEKFWRRMLGGQARSGLSISAWCRAHDVNEPAFYWWRRRLTLGSRHNRRAISRRRSRVAGQGLARTDRERKMRSTKPTLVPIHVSQPEAGSGGSPIEIVLSGDRRIRVTGRVDREMLADVLAVLAGSSHPGRLEASAC